MSTFINIRDDRNKLDLRCLYKDHYSIFLDMDNLVTSYNTLGNGNKSLEIILDYKKTDELGLYLKYHIHTENIVTSKLILQFRNRDFESMMSMILEFKYVIQGLVDMESMQSEANYRDKINKQEEV